MTVRIRLQRLGKPQNPYYRVVAIDKRSKRNGKPIEILGNYNTLQNERELTLKTDRINYWVERGAQVSERVNYLLKEQKKSVS